MSARTTPLYAVLFVGVVSFSALLPGCDEADTVTQVEADASVEQDAVIVDAFIGPDADLTGIASEGQPLYEQFCGFCHGDAGEGYLADNANALSNPNFLATATDEFIRIGIIEGRPGTPMSPWGIDNEGPLDDLQVNHIVAYIRSWQTEDNPPLDIHEIEVDGTAMRGQAAYNAFCQGCHGDVGQGVSAMSLNNPWFHASATDGFIRHAIEEGRPGTPMPGYANQVSPQTIDDLVVLIRSWARPVDSAPPEVFEVDLTQALINDGGADADFELRDGRFAPAAAIKAAMDEGQAFILIDARPRADYLMSHIDGALSIPFYQIEDFVD
jgi:mono/diheme cytochrome c family protein